MDKLIGTHSLGISISKSRKAYINGKPEYGVQIKYSTLSDYFDALQDRALSYDVKFPVFYEDFFPYADNEDSYWTVQIHVFWQRYKSICRDITPRGHS